MTYSPLTISHISDVLPHVEGRRDFVVAECDGYSVIDYVYAGSDTFDHPTRIECRGLKFAPDGTILARPFEKFFNIGERPDTQPHVLDFNEPHTVMEKLDGSMIHPAIVHGEVVFMTRMGRTDVARLAERHLTNDVERECRNLLGSGFTPIFEWTAPDNRIVIPYASSRLTLLAIRGTQTGAYWTWEEVCDEAAFMGLEAVEIHDSESDGVAFLALARAVTGKEGFVVRFSNGLSVKAKGEDYVLKHRAKDSVLQEKNVLALVMRDGLDDVLPLLDATDRANVERYRDAVHRGIAATSGMLSEFVARHAGLSQKEFALGPAAGFAGHPYRPLAFTIRGGIPAEEAVRAYVIAKAGAPEDVRSITMAHFTAFNDNLSAEVA